MIKCDYPGCTRKFEKQKELDMHKKFFHGVGKKQDVCPDCGGPIIFQEGCRLCPNCGWSKCG